MKKFFALFLIMTLLLEGCWDQKVYEKTGFILQVGIEASSKDNNLLISYSDPVVEPDSKEQVEVIYSDEENLLREFREDSRKISAKLLEGGKIQQVLISSSLAEKGINNLLEVFEREPTIPVIARLVITDGSPKELIEKAQTFGDKPRPAFYVHQLIDNNIAESYVPQMEISQFTTQYYSPGLDPIVPLVKLEFHKGKGIEVEGAALFSSDKMVGKINTWETVLLISMMGKLKSSVYINKSIADPGYNNGKRGCAFNISKAKRKLKVQVVNNAPVVNISLKFNGVMKELYWNGIKDLSSQKSIENLLANEIKKNCEHIIEYTKSVRCDCLGIGDYVRAKYNPYWQKIEWNDVYPFVKFNIDVNVNITNYGVIH
ncbi:Ger(x)C family spore germination protein [Clostridium sp. 19966]|uniref:Ger(x)C family spore germination protein n=1 Tax=Clostridium sp. 19966 TaxID=2768166 RepID=UPI0028DFB443|nr:Ger(x)C family spore germination protein [Clostridium sp. 19966]MDT8717993.1 Ger(x)C family spore germination protein [Clostridium sp. 19966]